MRPAAVLAGAAVLASACHAAAHPPRIVQPGAPGRPGAVITASAAAELSQIKHSAADVAFMQGMIRHHAQALEMTLLLPARTTNESMRLLAQRIDASQTDEIQMMTQWLNSRGEPAAGEHDDHAEGAMLMPGMLSPEEMGRLATANGVEFERLFLELMTKHHQGALTMVRELFATAGAGQESEIFAFASDVVADQRAEIARMGTLLQERAR